MGREENAAVFQDTEKMCKENKILAEAIKYSTANQKLILENVAREEILGNLIKKRINNSNGEGDKDFNLEATLKKYDEKANIVVSKKRSYEAASAYKSYKTCVHNFASASTPGGGVVKGSGAQEECLCRCSTLYFSLNTKEMWDGFYGPHRATQDPVHNADCIYTPDVIVMKTDTMMPKRMSEKDWYKVDVITCAAPNLRLMPSNKMNPGDGNKRVKMPDSELQLIHEERLTRILDIAVANGEEVVILGAFGCGAFENNPKVVAEATKNVIEKYRYAFKTIEFAVYCNPRDESNYEIFKKEFA